MKRQVVVFVLVLCFLVGGMPTRVEAGGVYATEFTQLLNHVELIQQYLQQVQMVRNDLLRYADMLKHGTPLTNQVYGPVTQDLQQLHKWFWADRLLRIPWPILMCSSGIRSRVTTRLSAQLRTIR